MRQKVRKTSQLVDNTIRKVCGRIPQKKRKVVVLGMSFLFIGTFFVMLWDTFLKQDGEQLIDIKHMKPLDLPQDSLIHKHQNIFHGEKQ